MIDQPTMTPVELRDAQRQLALSDAQLSILLGFESGQHVRRLKADEGKAHHRSVQGAQARLLRAYLDGYRPRDWPVPADLLRRLGHLESAAAIAASQGMVTSHDAFAWAREVPFMMREANGKMDDNVWQLLMQRAEAAAETIATTPDRTGDTLPVHRLT